MSDDQSGPKTAATPDLGKWIGLGVGAGIGSAALAAALLYASRASRRTVSTADTAPDRSETE